MTLCRPDLSLGNLKQRLVDRNVPEHAKISLAFKLTSVCSYSTLTGLDVKVTYQSIEIAFEVSWGTLASL